eukprot:768093-Hanusia_phi.AAC.3
MKPWSMRVWLILAMAAMTAEGGERGAISDGNRGEDIDASRDKDLAASSEAEFRWAQRKDRILLTIDLQMESSDLRGQGHTDAEVYNVTHCEVNARDVSCTLMKAKREAYW